MSFGALPYPGWNNATVVEKVNEGYRLPKPAICPEDLYEVMKSCWDADPDARPTFAELHSKILNFCNIYSASEESVYN